MEIRLGPHNLADALPRLLRTVSTEHTKGTISDGEYHMFKDHLLSREIHAVKRVNQQLLVAQARDSAPQQVVAKLAQLPRDPISNRSSFGSMVVILLTSPEGAARRDHEQQQLHSALRRAIHTLQTSFGDRIKSVSFEIAGEVPQPPRLLQNNRPADQVSQPPKMVLNKEGEWVYPSMHIHQQVLDNCQGSTASLQQQQRQPISSDQVNQCVLHSFRISYRVRQDDQGSTIGGGVNQDRDVLSLSLDQPCLTQCLAQKMIKSFASCLN